MLVKQQLFLLLLLFASLNEINLLQNLPTRTSTIKTLPLRILNRNTNSSSKKILNVNFSATPIINSQTSTISPEDIPNSIDATAEEIKNEVFVNDLLEIVEEQDDINETIPDEGPHYEMNWDFTDKYTIRVTFDLYSIPTSLIENSRNTETNKRKLNLLATMATISSRSLKSITVLKYFRFIIRPYHKNREIVQKMEKLNIKNTTSRKYNHFSNVLRLTSLNHHEKYSVCICYYQTNTTTKSPDLFLCQDVINDYSKFSHLRTDPKHGLVFIITQYSIIIALLIVLQSVFTMRKRRIAQIIGQIVSNKAHSIRTTLSSVSLGRQSFSSLDAAAEQQQHATGGHAIPREAKIDEESGLKKRIISSPAIVISEPATSMNHGANSSEETEPFLKHVSSKNHVHFLLGPNEGSDDDDENLETENTDGNTTQRGPYDDQTDALLSMAHILDTNKPWSRHSHNTSPV